MTTLGIAIQGSQPEQVSWIEVTENDNQQDILDRVKRCLHLTKDESVEEVLFILEDVNYEPVAMDDLQLSLEQIVNLAHSELNHDYPRPR